MIWDRGYLFSGSGAVSGGKLNPQDTWLLAEK